MPNKKELGERIKRFRLERNLTLKDVELKAKVSATHVSEIERGMTSPTVGALTKIAKALGSEPSYFLNSNALPPVSLVKKDERKSFSYDEWGAKVNRLSTGIRDSSMSFLELELEPGNRNELEPMTHTGEEFMHIIKGVVEIFVGLERHRLKEGDSIHFKSHEPHTIRNIGDAQARLLWISLPPFQL